MAALAYSPMGAEGDSSIAPAALAVSRSCVPHRKGDATMTMSVFVLGLFLALYTSQAAAQGTVEDYRQLTETQRYYYVAGYVSGFATASLAAEAPGSRADLLQKCFADWPVPKVVAIFDKWIDKNPDKRAPGWTARVGLYAAIAESCGWARKPCASYEGFGALSLWTVTLFLQTWAEGEDTDVREAAHQTLRLPLVQAGEPWPGRKHIQRGMLPPLKERRHTHVMCIPTHRKKVSYICRTRDGCLRLPNSHLLRGAVLSPLHCALPALPL